MSTVCARELTDHAGATVSCTRRPGHKDDHGRGFLRWENDGSWYTKRYIPRSPGQPLKECPLCTDSVYDFPEHLLDCAEVQR